MTSEALGFYDLTLKLLKHYLVLEFACRRKMTANVTSSVLEL